MSEAKVDFAGRLNQAFDRLGIPAKQHGRFTALSRLFGVSAVAARDWCEGKSYPSVDKLLVIMDTVRCGADWLLYGRSGPGTAPAQTSEFSRIPPPRQPADLPADQPVTQSSNDPGHGGSEAWLRLGSDAMAPTLLPGDAVRLGPVEAAGLEDGLHALAPIAPGSTGTVWIRRLLRRLDGSLQLACDNPLYAERVDYREGEAGKLQGLAPATPDLQVLGRVIEVRRLVR